VKVIFSHGLPFFLAHGGVQTLIEALGAGLRELGVEVEPERWWDDAQTGDVLHYFGRPRGLNVRLAHAKGFKVVMTELLDQTASRSGARLFVQKQLIRAARRLLGPMTGRLGWDVYGELDALVYAVPYELAVAHYLFGAPLQRARIIPHGLDPSALADLQSATPEGADLLCVATIHPRKNSVLLAEAARLAQVPVTFVGKPYAESDPYFARFRNLVDDRYVRFAGFLAEEEKRRRLRAARGFVLLSQQESGGIAVYEAAAAGLPLLLPDLPWAREGYPESERIRFTALDGPARVARRLKEFYEQAHRSAGEPTFPVPSWQDVAREYREVYRSVLADGSRPPRDAASPR